MRRADPGRDAQGCAEIYAEYVRDTVISFESTAPTREDMLGRIERAHAWLVAEADGRTAGFAYGGPHRERAAYRWATDVSVYVESGHHRRGIGKALYTELFDRLRTQGLLVACAGVTLPNAASVGLHESLGFVPVGVYRRIGFKFGAWHDVGWWQLDLAPRRDGETPPEPCAP